MTLDLPWKNPIFIPAYGDMEPDADFEVDHRWLNCWIHLRKNNSATGFLKNLLKWGKHYANIMPNSQTASICQKQIFDSKHKSLLGILESNRKNIEFGADRIGLKSSYAIY